MNELQIENPVQTISFDLSWLQLKEHILKIVATFPKEYSIIKNEDEKFTLLNTPLGGTNKVIGKDQLIYIDRGAPTGTKTALKITMTNEDHKISSATELERDKKWLEIFTTLLKKSIDGTLVKPRPDPGKALLRLLIFLIVAAAVLYGLKVLMHK